MKCLHCGTKNASVKKTCTECGNFLEGWTVNNVTGEYGYREADGSFTLPDETQIGYKENQALKTTAWHSIVSQLRQTPNSPTLIQDPHYGWLEESAYVKLYEYFLDYGAKPKLYLSSTEFYFWDNLTDPDTPVKVLL